MYRVFFYDPSKKSYFQTRRPMGEHEADRYAMQVRRVWGLMAWVERELDQ